MSPSARRQQIGQLLFAGFKGIDVPVELRSLAREFGLGGTILFARNVEEPAQVAELAYGLATLTPDLPAWVSVDQEGGRVARLKAPFTEWPPMATLGRSADVTLAESFARAIAVELKAVGVTMDFAPVLDVHTNPKNPVIGDRALAEDAKLVARLGATIIKAMQAEGVAACGKHFPGHGDTNLDSHFALPLVEHPPEVLRERELLPFKAAIAADVASIMTAHVFIPALDEDSPATLSKCIISDILRTEMGFQGLILSDDLEMKALANERPVPDSAVLAIEAGCDGILICAGDYDVQAAALEAIVKRSETDRSFLRSVDDALARNRRVKERFLATSVDAVPNDAAALRRVLGRDAHRRTADSMARFA